MGALGAGGEAGDQPVEAAGGTGDVAPERDDQADMAGIVQERMGDQGGEREQDAAQPAGDVRGGGDQLCGERAGLHELIPSRLLRPAQAESGWWRVPGGGVGTLDGGNQFNRFLWKRPDFMIAAMWAPWSWK